MEFVCAMRGLRFGALTIVPSLALLLAACGGGSNGSEQHSGVNKTYLSVDAADHDGDALQYQWRVTSGTIENRNARETVWTMPDGPGLHFAYVTVSDGKGGYTSQQYAVSSDTLGTVAPTRVAVTHVAPTPTEPEGATMRLRFVSSDATNFASSAGPVSRLVYLPDVQVSVVPKLGGAAVFTGVSDLSGEVKLPKLVVGQEYVARCSSSSATALVDCLSFTAGENSVALSVSPVLAAGQNLRVFGHVGDADGGVCGTHDEFFGIETAATVQLQMPDGTPLTAPRRVNRFGDYELDAATAVSGSFALAVQCEGYRRVLAVPAAGAGGYVGTAPVELSHAMANSRPRIVKVVANGPDGNVRGKMIVTEATASSNGLPGPDRFLTYKGLDTKRGVCQYYLALGAVGSCDAQGNMVDAISFDDWKRLNGFQPSAGANAEVAANYINKRDLNLVRRMVATQTATDHIAFYVCNHPGPDGTTQKEVDDLMEAALKDEKLVACVAMEWSPTAGVNGGHPYTKFFTFAPDGRLLGSVNLDGRGEKYLPGSCVACHGGNKYSGRFPEQGGASAYLGSNFLPFDTGNYLFSSEATLGEPAQSAALFELNRLVRATEASDTTATSKLIKGWYANGSVTTLDKTYVPPSWTALDADPGYVGAARFYREVVGTSCRTCHTSLGAGFDWDSQAVKFKNPLFAKSRFCGGDADIALNASMPNALITHDRLMERARADASLAALMTKFLGCSAVLPDPAYPQR